MSKQLHTPRLILAPMEGLADEVLRDVLTGAAHYDVCVTEFVRVTNSVLPRGAFLRRVPELGNASHTPNGTPTRVQLLGSDPVMMAANAARLATLAPCGIDLNFGCPAPQVNKHRGGAALLGEPDLLHDIVQAVRAAVPAEIPVTAKMRLGIDDTGLALACAEALATGGAAELTVHARTKADAYKPPARWEWLARIRERVHIPLIANGEVWTLADYLAIREISGCDDVMVGRGAVADPLLVQRIRSWQVTGISGRPDTTRPLTEADEAAVLALVALFWEKVNRKLPGHQSPGRLKQWLGLLRRTYPAAARLHDAVRPRRLAAEIDPLIAAACHAAQLKAAA